jgi:hypothetical protein
VATSPKGRGDGLVNTLQSKDLLCRESVVALTPQPNVLDRWTTAKGMCNVVIELEKVPTLAASTLAVHKGALSGVALPDLSAHLGWDVS